MTRSRYYLLRLGQAFGIKFTSRHGTAAANEAHLLRDAESILGALVWKDLEEVEELSMEYWRLRKLTKEFQTLMGGIERAQEVLDSSHNKRSAYLEEVIGSTKEFVDEREELMEKHDRLSAERQLILGEARSIKRRYDGLKAKIEVLTEEGRTDGEGFAETKEELNTLKKRFRALRLRRDEIGEEIGSLDAVISNLDQEIEERRAKVKTEASDDFDAIGQANRNISSTRGKLTVLEEEIDSLHHEIGRFLCNNADDDAVAPIVRPHRRLITQIKLLRESVHMNRVLGKRYKDPV